MNVVVVAAHPDDEALGCGGTMARHAAASDMVRVVFLTNGVSARAGASEAEATSRRLAAERALAILGVTEAEYLKFPDNALDSVPRLELVRGIEAVMARWTPDIIYTHHPSDLNIDHRRAFEAVLTACRPQPANAVERILSFEVPSSTGWTGASGGRTFAPNYFVEITPFLARKIEALDAYAEEMREFPHARSMKAVEALAVHRGTQVGVAAAEAFALERLVCRHPGETRC